MSAGSPAAVHSRQEEWLAALELAVQEVFEIMLGTRLAAAPGTTAPAGEFTAIVGVTGALRGVLSFSCGAQTATLIATRMLGPEPVNVEGQVCDGLGEICNMIAGNFKNKLTGIDGRCLLSVPTVITGRAYQLHSLTGGDRLEIVLLLEGLPVVVRLALHA